MKRIILTLCLIVIAYAARSQFVFVFLNSKPDKEQIPKEEAEKIQEGHMANIKRLAKEGRLLAAGPFEGGGGIFIFKSASVTQVEEWLSSDPGIKAKRWNIEKFPYTSLVGSVCPVGENYEMVTYQFVRYEKVQSKNEDRTAKEQLSSHAQHADSLGKKFAVIAGGTLGEHNDIFVIKGEVPDEWLGNDPAVKAGLVTATRKKLYIARGSFCEQ